MIFTAMLAPRFPSAASVSRWALRERTRANSAATKNALRRKRTRTASSSRAVVIGFPQGARGARRYFGRRRRRSSGDAATGAGGRVGSRRRACAPVDQRERLGAEQAHIL